MIKCNDDGIVEIRGRKFELMAELTVIIRELKAMRVITDDDLQSCVELAAKTDDELSAELDDKIKNMVDDMVKNIDIDKLIKDIFHPIQ